MGGTLLAIADRRHLDQLRHPARHGRAPGTARAAQPVRRASATACTSCAGTARCWLAALGICYFWFLGALLQLRDPARSARSRCTSSDVRIALLGTWLAIGIGVGSMAAGRLSGDRRSSWASCRSARSAWALRRAGALAGDPVVPAGVRSRSTVLGFAGGLFAVPLNALLQQRPDDDGEGAGHRDQQPDEHRRHAARVRRAVAARRRDMHLSPERIILVVGNPDAGRDVYVLSAAAGFLRPLHAVAADAHDLPHPHRRAGARSVARRRRCSCRNHVSHVDGLLVGACDAALRPVHGLAAVSRDAALQPDAALHARDSGGRPAAQDVVASIDERASRARSRPRGLHLRGGRDQPHRQPAAVQARVRAHRRRASTCRSSRSTWIASGAACSASSAGGSSGSGRERLPYPVTVTFGPPLPSSSKAADVRQAVMALASEAMATRIERDGSAAPALPAHREAPLVDARDGRRDGNRADVRTRAGRIADALALDRGSTPDPSG